MLLANSHVFWAIPLPEAAIAEESERLSPPQPRRNFTSLGFRVWASDPPHHRCKLVLDPRGSHDTSPANRLASVRPPGRQGAPQAARPCPAAVEGAGPRWAVGEGRAEDLKGGARAGRTVTLFPRQATAATSSGREEPG